MIVSKRRYQRLLRAYDRVCTDHAMLKHMWNELVQTINSKGGEEFLNSGAIQSAMPLSNDELLEIRSLCHPDKHGNSDRATRITQRLNEILS